MKTMPSDNLLFFILIHNIIMKATSADFIFCPLTNKIFCFGFSSHLLQILLQTYKSGFFCHVIMPPHSLIHRIIEIALFFSIDIVTVVR